MERMRKMRTSASQFEIMVNFMEKRGDIHKPVKTPIERIRAIHNWKCLAKLLNNDATGEAKNIVKWSKIWSDFKSKTKKKSNLINRAIKSGSSNSVRLSELEQRVLKIIGRSEALSDVNDKIISQLDVSETLPLPWLRVHGLVTMVAAKSSIYAIKSVKHFICVNGSQWREDPIDTVNQMETQSLLFIPASVGSDVFVNCPVIDSSDVFPVVGTSYSLPPELPVNQSLTTNSILEQSPDQTEQTSLRENQSDMSKQGGHSPLQNPSIRSSHDMNSSRRRVKRHRYKIKGTTQYILKSDEDWRNFLKRKHEEEYSLEKEKLRIRELELETQKKWQDVALVAIDTFKKIIRLQNNVKINNHVE